MKGKLKMNLTTRNLTVAAVVGAAYAALTMALAPISFGAVQFRISEVFCILPFFLPHTAVGLFLGCAAANLLSAAGIMDVVFGSLATLLAGLCAARIGRTCRTERRGPRAGEALAACAMPVAFNAPIVGAVLAWLYTPGELFWSGFWLFGAQVGLGEAAVLFLLGYPAMRFLPRAKALQKWLYS